MYGIIYPQNYPNVGKIGHTLLGGGFKHFFIFTPKIGEDFQFDEHIFQMGGSTTNQIEYQWLITMVSKSPKWGYSPYKWPKWLVNMGY